MIPRAFGGIASSSSSTSDSSIKVRSGSSTVGWDISITDKSEHIDPDHIWRVCINKTENACQEASRLKRRRNLQIGDDCWPTQSTNREHPALEELTLRAGLPQSGDAT